MTTLGVISSGRGENLRYILKEERAGRLPAKVVIVLADQAGAGALKIAEEYKVPCRFLDPEGLSREDYDRRLIAELEMAGVELVILTGYMRILSPLFVGHYKDRILNIHPALLPSFRGMDAFSQALQYGVRWTGTTVHIVDEDVDHGPIVYQMPVPVRRDDTRDSLKARIQRAEYRAYPKAIKMFIEGRPRVEGRRLVWEKEP
ncbi:MAG TPA: phosphoribosylglycinamide formyltransferase [Methanothrix sp.]|nr:phosphoribosylglycinamide formyltransferase [Methanothrix sp.]HPC90395.1 phosphoribosylglycinamide formyltransferase [Methanothrix sp.]HQI68801.1 phosphoribosylglycinamide formyltransferase [Methanothrix sp.]HRS85750.1 phosphoribosylglycinamide formyltransferase [Methanothrix sp.]